jgi:ubiquinone/menaquinone biosynthesis C-methylase UbiE
MPRVSFPAFGPDKAYYEHVSHGYDLIAPTYDGVEAQNAVGRRLRRKMQDALFRTFRPGQRVLEVGCGTGIEALALAERGVSVVATDLSADMVGLVARKARDRGLSNVETRKLAAHEIGALIDRFGPASFDGAYSHGGALNMDPRIDAFAAAIPKLLRPSARFLCTVVNQASLFETLFYPLVLRPRKAFRRLGNDIPIPITRHDAHRTYVVPTRFYSPRSFLATFDGAFELRRLEGLQIFLPPWNLSDYVDRLAPLARAAEAIEERLGHRRPFNSWGSLFLAELERVPEVRGAA